MSNASSDVRRLLSAPVLPILTAADEDSAVGCARALAAAGVPAIEVTLRGIHQSADTQSMLALDVDI